MEKYDFSEQDANDMASFLVPLLDFVPEKRPTAAQCLSHPWMSAGPQILQPSLAMVQTEALDVSMSEEMRREKAAQEVVEIAMGNISIDGVSKPLVESQP